MIEAADGAAPFGAAAGEEDRVMAQSLVPVIDIELFLSGGAEAKARVAAEVDDACRNIGFLVIAGHGVAEAQTEAVRRVTRAFFDLPHWDKLRVKMPPDRYRGFMAVGSEDVAYSMDEHQNAPDWRECFVSGPSDHAYDEYHYGPDGWRFFAANLWPDMECAPEGGQDQAAVLTGCRAC